MKKNILKGKKLSIKAIIAIVTSVVAISAIGIGLGVGLSGGDDKKSQVPILTFSKLKDKLENMSNDPIVVERRIDGTSWRNITDEFFTNVIHQPIIMIPSIFEVQYQIANTLLWDGDLTIDLRMRKKGDEVWTSVNSYTISVTGIIQSEIAKEFNVFSAKILDRNSENGLLEVEESEWSDTNNKYFVSPYVEQLPYISSIKILALEDPIKKDGNAIIKFEVTLSTNQISIVQYEFKVGKDTWDAKEILENMNTHQIFKESEIASTDWKNLDDDFFNTIIEKEKPNLPDNTEIQYQIKDAVSNNGNQEASNLVVDFRYRRKDITNDLWTDISSQYRLGIFWDKDLFDAQTALKDLSKDDISFTSDIEAVPSWQQITDEVYSNILKVNPPSIPANIEVQYQIPNAVTQDGNLVINLRYKKTSSSNWYSITHRVRVNGINIGKAKTYVSNLQIKDKQYFFDNVNNLISTFGSTSVLTKENANLIFNFSEGEEFQEPSIQNLIIYLLVENLIEESQLVRVSIHFVYNNFREDLVYDFSEND